MSDLKFHPRGNRVILRLAEDSGRTEGGLFIPENAVPQDAPKEATVVATSLGYWVGGTWAECPFKVGDRVLVDALGGTRARICHRDYLVVRHEDIIGKFEDE